MKTVRFNQSEFHYQQNGTGETVVFIHGSASDARTWNEQLPAFGKNYNAVSYSRRFHWPNEQILESEDYSMLQHVEDLKGFLKYLGNQPAHLIGHSYGALMALELACQQPDLIRSMVLAEPPAITLFTSSQPTPLELLKLLLTRPATALAVIKLGATGLGPAAKAASKNNMEMAMTYFGKAALGPETFARMTDDRKKQVLANLTKAEFLGSGFLPLKDEKLRSLNLPILLLNAENSPRVFHHLAARLNELLPNCSRAIIPAASHIMHEDKPSAFNTTVLSFVAKNGGN